MRQPLFQWKCGACGHENESELRTAAGGSENVQPVVCSKCEKISFWCIRCNQCLPTDREIGELCDRRKLESRESLKKKRLGFCVCPERLWQRKPHLVAAVLAVKYPKMNWGSLTGKNRIASWIMEWLAGNSEKKALTATERRRLYEFREKGTEILYKWGLEYSEVEIPLIVFLDNLLSNPFIEVVGRAPHTPAEMDEFMRAVAEDPSLLRMLLQSEITGRVLWPDKNAFGYDPDGMKEELYNDHPEYQAILDGYIDDYGYDECVSVLENRGLGLDYLFEMAEGAEAEAEMELPTDPIDFEKERELAAIEMDKLRARMIAALKQMVILTTSKSAK